MKKMFILMVLSVLIFSLVGCNTGPSNNGNGDYAPSGEKDGWSGDIISGEIGAGKGSGALEGGGGNHTPQPGQLTASE